MKLKKVRATAGFEPTNMLLVHFHIFFNGEPNSFLKDDAPPNKNIHHIAIGGRYRIRTYGPVTACGFQDRRNKPLCQSSKLYLAESVGLEPTDRFRNHGLANRSLDLSGNLP